MKNIIKKILILTGLLIFSCNTNFCMQNQNIIKTIKGPNGKWEVIKSKKILSSGIETKIAQVVNIKSGEIVHECSLVPKDNRQKNVIFSPNGKYVGLQELYPTPDERKTAPYGKLIILDLERNTEEKNTGFEPSFNHDKQYFSKQYDYDEKLKKIFNSKKDFWDSYITSFQFSPCSKYIIAEVNLLFKCIPQTEHSYRTRRIFNIANKQDETKKILAKNFKKAAKTSYLGFSPIGKFIELEHLGSTIIFDRINPTTVTAEIKGFTNKEFSCHNIEIRYSLNEDYIAHTKPKTITCIYNCDCDHNKEIAILNLNTKNTNLWEKKDLQFDKNVKNIYFLASQEISEIKSDYKTEILNLKKEKIENKNISPKDVILKVELEESFFNPQKPQFILIEKSKNLGKKVNKKRIRIRLIDTIVVCQQ